MKKIKYHLLFILVSMGCFLYAQKEDLLPDGVKATESYIDTIIKNYSDENAFAFDIETITNLARIPITVHIIRNIEGKAGVAIADINDGIDMANNHFENIGIHFFIDTINYVDDYNYSFINYNSNRKELLSIYAKSKQINLYLADSIQMGTEMSYGYTYFPDAPDSNYIFLNKEYINGNYLTTMLGHYFGLLSTHETLGGNETANEENCDGTGDFICDTWADPDLFQQVDTTCHYTGEYKDGNSDFYVPTVANIMSNTLDGCKCKFTTLQYRRMYYYFMKYRQYSF